MNTEDKREFISILKATQEYYDKPVSESAASIYWRGLADVSLEDFRNAMNSHIRNCKFMPKVADILDAIPDGWPDPEEAWNLFPKSEYEGGYMNQAMGEAMGACADSVGRGDMVAARVAFIESYKGRVGYYRSIGEPPSWWYSGSSLGTLEQKEQQKEQALIKARDKGWISKETANQKLLEMTKPSAELLMLAGSGLKKIGNG